MRKVIATGLGLLIAVLGTVGMPVVYAEEESAESVIEEVIVTATRRETSQQSTALSITTITPEQIEKRFMTDIRGVADLSPNVVMENVTGFNAASFAIRGTGTNDIITTIDTAIGVVIDGFALAHSQSQLLDSFDVESIEILRGPQGTLFGKNTTGGVVNVRTKRPIMDELNADFVARVGTDGVQQSQVAVNVPILDETLAARFVYSKSEHDGFYKNDKIHSVYDTPALPQTPLGLPVNGDGRELGGTEVELFRGKLLWEPNDNYSAQLSLEWFEDTSESPPAVNETPVDGVDSQGIFRSFLFNALGFPGVQTTCRGRSDDCVFHTGVSFRGDGLRMEQGHRTDKFTLVLEQNYETENMSYYLNLGYLDQEERLPSTYTGEAFPSLFDATRNVEREQKQIEFRMTSDYDGPFNFTTGVGWFENELDWRSISYVGFTAIPSLTDTDGDSIGDVPTSALPGLSCDIENIDAANGFSAGGVFLDGNGCVLLNPTANDRTNYAPRSQDGMALGIYFDSTIEVSDAMNVTLGIRYSDEEKDFFAPTGASLTEQQVALFNNTGGDDTLDGAVPLSQFDFVVDESESWDGVSLRAGIDYQFNDNVFGYFMASEGFKSGSFVETCASISSCNTPFDRETATQYEFGLKTDLLDRKLRVNASVFFIEFEDVVRSQVVQITNRFGDPDQETQFRNIASQENTGGEVEVIWYPTDSLKISANASFLDCEYQDFSTDFDGDGLNDDASGLEPNFCPDNQFYVDAAYDIMLGNGGRLTLFSSVHHTPESEYSVFNSDFTQLEERTLVNASVSYEEPQERWRLSLFGNNLTDEIYRVSANSVAGLWNFSNYGPRQQLGLELRVSLRGG